MQKSRRARDKAGYKRILMMDRIETIDLVKKVLDFLGLELQWITGAKQSWLIEAMTGDLVTACMELPTGELFEQPLEVARDSLFLKSRMINDYEIVYRTFIEALGSIKKLYYGLNVETLAPKKILDNPFFNHRSLEEIAVKLDLLAGEKER